MTIDIPTATSHEITAEYRNEMERFQKLEALYDLLEQALAPLETLYRLYSIPNADQKWLMRLDSMMLSLSTKMEKCAAAGETSRLYLEELSAAMNMYYQMSLPIEVPTEYQ